MAINLADITSAVQTYLNKKVVVAITDVTPADGDGKNINPGEEFVVQLSTTNADAASGGVTIRNLKYRVTVDDGSVAKLVVPGTLINRTTSLDGKTVFAEGEEHTGMIIDHFVDSTLAPGDVVPFTVKGKAGDAAKGGKTSVNVRALADVDLDALFPQGEDTPETTASVKVQAD
jgi:hypothetical protein